MVENRIWKQKALYVIWGCALLMSLFCIIKMVMPNQSYFYSGEAVFNDGVARENAVIYEHIALPLGVYDIVLEYDTDTSMKNLCKLQDSTVFTGGLLTNYEFLHKDLTNTDYRMWLFESTEELQVCILYGGEGYVITGNLTIRETDVLWSMLLVIIWGITLICSLILMLKKHDHAVGIDREKKDIFCGLLIIVLIASLPFLRGGIVSGGDTGYHLMRIEGVKDSLLSGQFPLRLEPEWLFGHGYANGIFYCGTLLYFPAILRLLGFTVTASYNIFCIVINMATAVIAYYCFSRMFRDRYIGLLCCALHTLSIYRIYKFIMTGALGEGTAYTFLPLILYGLYRAFSEEVTSEKYKTVWVPISIGYAGLLQTHVLSCEIAAFLTILVCLIFIRKVFVKQTFLELAKGASAAIIASLWYLVPFLDYYINEDMHIKHVSGRTIQERGLYLPVLFFNWWKTGENVMLGDRGMQGSDPMGIGLILVIGWAVFCILWFSGKWRGKNDNIISMAKVACVLGSMLMLMSLNVFPWDRIQNINSVTASLVSSLQFPNRFLAWGTVLLVSVCGSLLWYFRKSGRKFYFYLSIICILAGLTTSNLYLIDHVCRDQEYIYLYNEESMGGGYISGAEYLIEGTDTTLIDYNLPVEGENVEIVKYDKEYLHMWVKCKNESAEESYIELPMLHYKGYRAYVTSSGTELETSKGDNNVVRVSVPAGFDGEIEVMFKSPVYWRISEGITYLWWLFVIVLGIRHCTRREKVCVK